MNDPTLGRPILTSIGEWSLNASSEDIVRFFYTPEKIDQIKSGKFTNVIGRKGAGKTALFEYISRHKSWDFFSRKMYFRDFPFNLVYRLSDNSFKNPNQFTSLWRFAILSSLAELVAGNERIRPDARVALDAFRAVEPKEQLSRSLGRWLTKRFGISLFDVGVDYTMSQSAQPAITPQAWIDQLRALEKILEGCIDDSTYFILFDALDDDYRNIIEAKDGQVSYNTEYLSLVTSLFRAAQSVKDHFASVGAKVYPMIFLRSDIYDIIQDNDKNKWSDFKYDLTWHPGQLRHVIAHRISRSHHVNGSAFSFDEAMGALFSNRHIPTRASKAGSGPGVDVFDYIMLRTLLRPRDFIFYLKTTAATAMDRGLPQITPNIVLSAEVDYANYLRRELVDEMQPILPAVDKIFSAMTYIQQRRFRGEDFSKALKQAEKNGQLRRDEIVFDDRQILQLLYNFSCIGNLYDGRRIFHYTSPGTALDVEGDLLLHSGLVRTLGTRIKGAPRRYP